MKNVDFGVDIFGNMVLSVTSGVNPTLIAKKAIRVVKECKTPIMIQVAGIKMGLKVDSKSTKSSVLGQLMPLVS
jgi:hypothetical protein